MEKRNSGIVDRYPDLSEKKALRTSTSTTLRKRTPTNEFTASKFTNFVFDHSKQLAVWPDGSPNTLIESTQKTGNTRYKTMNKTGQPFALGTINVGGSPDDPGHPYLKAKKQGMFK